MQARALVGQRRRAYNRHWSDVFAVGRTSPRQIAAHGVGFNVFLAGAGQGTRSGWTGGWLIQQRGRNPEVK